MKNLKLHHKRLIIAILMILSFSFVLNYHFGWDLIYGYDRIAMNVSFFVLAIAGVSMGWRYEDAKRDRM
jgi:hypothetical protein